MKKIIYFILLIPFCSFTQKPFDTNAIGVNDSEFLNQSEINYTKYLLARLYPDSTFDLNQKKILFTRNNYGAVRVSKSYFFDKECKPWVSANKMPHIQIIELTESEANEIGFDIILIAWSKIPSTGKARKRFIKNARQLEKN